MDGEKCLWFKEEWTDEKRDFIMPGHSDDCPYSSEYLVEGTGRCIFHLSKEHEEKAKRFEGALGEILSNEAVVWTDEKSKNEYVDLFGFIFPDEFSLKVVLDKHPPELPLCLVSAHLRGADLFEVHLQYAHLCDVQLQGANLSLADLQGANFYKAHLQGADLSVAHLQGAYFLMAHLQGAELIGAQLQGADLSEAHLQGADLGGAQLQGADLSLARLCADPAYQPGEEWDEWIRNSENNEPGEKNRLQKGKERLMGGLDAANLIWADLGAGQCKGDKKIKLTATENEYREKTYKKMKKYVDSRGTVTRIEEGDELVAVELELTPTVLKGTDLRGVDLRGSTIAGADFTSARLDGTLLRGTKFGVKKHYKDGERRYDSRWHRKNRWLYASKIKKGRIKLFKGYRRLKPKWLRFLLRPFIKLHVKATMIRADLPIFDGANIEAADWADNRRAQRDFIYAEYIRQFKHNHPHIAFLWRILADYGRSLLRWALWSIGFSFLFAYLYYANNLIQYSIKSLTLGFWECFYFSVVTFTTLGFGDIEPVIGLGQTLVTVEVILGYVMLGGLISIFAVKVARRD